MGVAGLGTAQEVAWAGVCRDCLRNYKEAGEQAKIGAEVRQAAGRGVWDLARQSEDFGCCSEC
jgi:hypothetical protein